MKISELIEKLSELPSDVKVVFIDHDGIVCDITGVVEDPGRVCLTWEAEDSILGKFV